jgi:uncharacterized membrane protein YdjX (TVP38/TMEM64 family)
MNETQHLAGDEQERRRLLGSASFRSMLAYLTLGALLAVAIAMVGREIGHHINAIESWIANLGPWSVPAFIGLFVLATSFLFPETVLAIVAGALFGLGWGLVAAVAGNLLAATLQFALARHLLRNRIQRALATRPPLAAIQRAVNHDAFRLQVLLRLTPLNPTTISYLLGATGVRFPGFLTACLALIPNVLIEVYFGHVGKHVARMAGHDTRTVYLHDLAILGGLAACVILVTIVSRMARKAVLEAVAKTENREKPSGR